MKFFSNSREELKKRRGDPSFFFYFRFSHLLFRSSLIAGPRHAFVIVLLLSGVTLLFEGSPFAENSALGGESRGKELEGSDFIESGDTLPSTEAAKGIESGGNELDAAFDPSLNGNFLLSFVVSFERLPREGRKLLILGKTERILRLTRGWAIAISTSSTSARPEIFWRGGNSGGWNVFDRFEIRPGARYAFTLISKPNEFLALYSQRLDGEGTGEGVIFLGGADISQAGVPRTRGGLYRGRFRGGPSQLLIASPEKLPKNIAEAKRFVDGGPKAILDKLSKNELNVWRE